MIVSFDLGMGNKPIRRSRRYHLYFELRFGGQPYRKPNEGYMAYCISLCGKKMTYGTVSIKDALTAFEPTDTQWRFLKSMEAVMKNDMYKFTRCVPQQKKLFIARLMRKYKGLICDAEGVGTEIFNSNKKN